MTEDNSSWFGKLLGKPWLWIKGNSNSAVVSPTCVLSMHPQYQVFLSANNSRLSRGNDSSTEKIITVRTSRTLMHVLFLCQQQLHISNTEHVQCACNDYKLQELTFKCLNLYFVRVIRTLKGGLWDYKFIKMINLGSNVIVYKLKHCVLHFEVNMMTF